MLYLQYELLRTSYDWRLEESLQRLITKTNGNINPNVELLIARTFILENKEWFLKPCLNIFEKSKNETKQLCRAFLISIHDRAKNKENQGYSDSFINDLRESILRNGNIVPVEIEKIKRDINHEESDLSIKPNGSKLKRRDLSSMSTIELSDFIKENLLSQEEVNSLVDYFNKLNGVSEETRRLVSSFYTNIYRYASPKIDTSVLFKNNSELSVYYWVSRYVYDYDGWFRSLVNIAAFTTAYKIDKQQSINYLCEILFQKLNLESSNALSANLINGLTAINYDSEIIKQSWENLFEGIAYRLPFKDAYPWDEALKSIKYE